MVNTSVPGALRMPLASARTHLKVAVLALPAVKMTVFAEETTMVPLSIDHAAEYPGPGKVTDAPTWSPSVTVVCAELIAGAAGAVDGWQWPLAAQMPLRQSPERAQLPPAGHPAQVPPPQSTPVSPLSCAPSWQESAPQRAPAQ
jgi:hypothetical protein